MSIIDNKEGRINLENEATKSPVLENTPQKKDSITDILLNIENTIKNYKDDPTVITDSQKFKLFSTNRFATNAAKEHWKDKKNIYLPILKIDQVIWVNFSGIGSELDNEHMAVIINCNQSVDTVTILPLTSFKNESTIEDHLKFSIGTLTGQNKKSVALFSQITTISRKRVLNHKLTNYHNKEHITFLDSKQKELVKLGLKVNLLKEKHLFQELVQNEKIIPQFENPDEQYFHLKYPYQKNIIESTSRKLVYSIDNDPTKQYCIDLVPYDKSLSRKERKDFLNSWYRVTPNFDSKGNMTENRNVVRNNIYKTLLSYATI